MIFNQDNFQVFPLFPNVVGTVIVEENLSKLEEIKNLDYDHNNDAGSASTTAFNVLNSFPNERKIILDYFNRYKNNVLGYDNTDFDLTTSWGTKCVKGQYSDYHFHKNCVFSGVFYLDDVENGGELNFSNTGLTPNSIMLNRSNNPNPFNTDMFYMQPRKNMLVFFPSYLMHRISPYRGNVPRYSLAMNFLPTGFFGEKDSSVYISM